MDIGLIKLKEEIVFKINNLENENRRGASDIVNKSNTIEYYEIFKDYYNNRGLLSRALTELSCIDDNIYRCLNLDSKKYPYFCYERIVVSILRLRVCFDVETENIKEPLEELFHIAIDKIRSDDFNNSHSGFLLYQDIMQFVLESLKMTDTESSQMFFENKIKLKVVFTDFISIDDVKNIETANLYKELYHYKMVLSCPQYIKQAIKLTYIYDKNFSTVNSWCSYFSKYSKDRIDKDILLFQKNGFVNIPKVMKKIESAIMSMEISSKQKKENICDKVVKQFSLQIEQANTSEPFIDTINMYLSNYNK